MNILSQTSLILSVNIPRNMMLKRSRGKGHRGVGELVFFDNNPAVFLRKILGLFSMAKRQNSSRHPYALFHSAFKHHNPLCFI